MNPAIPAHDDNESAPGSWLLGELNLMFGAPIEEAEESSVALSSEEATERIVTKNAELYRRLALDD